MVRNYLAHVQLRPLDGSAPYTVETQFQAVGYPTAWNHVLALGHKFKATIMSHKLVELDDDGVIEGEVVGPTSVAVMNAAEMPKPTLTVKVDQETDLGWYGVAKLSVPEAVPFPYEEHTDDSVAA